MTLRRAFIGSVKVFPFLSWGGLGCLALYFASQETDILYMFLFVIIALLLLIKMSVSAIYFNQILKDKNE